MFFSKLSISFLTATNFAFNSSKYSLSFNILYLLFLPSFLSLLFYHEATLLSIPLLAKRLLLWYHSNEVKIVEICKNWRYMETTIRAKNLQVISFYRLYLSQPGRDQRQRRMHILQQPGFRWFCPITHTRYFTTDRKRKKISK